MVHHKNTHGHDSQAKRNTVLPQVLSPFFALLWAEKYQEYQYLVGCPQKRIIKHHGKRIAFYELYCYNSCFTISQFSSYPPNAFNAASTRFKHSSLPKSSIVSNIPAPTERPVIIRRSTFINTPTLMPDSFANAFVTS